ncbi:MAG: DUF3365 domain-containing protein [Opitutae bacterium]|nr:DUF3365 domain-containing protein [Opitutae bacterium]
MVLKAQSPAAAAAKPAAGPTITYFDATAPAPAAADGSTATFVAGGDTTTTQIAQYGFKMIEQIGGMMIAEVNRELANREISEAVSIMHLKTLELPKPVAGRPAITAIKRTSLLIRDPRNAPDAADTAALNKIHSQLMNDQTPDKMLVQKIERAGQPVEWRVYRPIAASQSCLACHGDPKTFRPGVKAALDLLYPEDKALDYGAKEWRGIIRVSLTAPAAAK